MFNQPISDHPHPSHSTPRPPPSDTLLHTALGLKFYTSLESIIYIHYSGKMRGVISLCLFFLGAITSLIGQASAAPSRELGDFHLGILGAGSSDMIAAAGNNRALQSSTVRSFDITITFVNSINLPAGYPLELTFYGPDGLPVETFTVYAPSPGSTEFYEFCLDASGQSSITSGGSDMDDTVLIVDIEPNVCPCGVSVCFDPHLQGLRGQHVEWTGVDGGWYALVKDDEDDLQINVRTTAPMQEDFPDRQFITGVSVISQGHSLVVEVKDPYTIETEGCSDVSPCLADGGLRVSVDGEVVNSLSGPTTDMHLPGGIELSASNLPAECREFGGRKVWARMQKEMERNLRQADSAKTFEEWVLSFTHMVAPDYCASFVANNDLSKVQSDQALLRIKTPTAAVRLSAGVNHRRAGKTDRYGRDLPELDFWQMGVGVEGLTLEHKSLTGLLGETARVVVDAEGHEVMEGTEALHGTIEDYRVSDVEGTDFALLHN